MLLTWHTWHVPTRPELETSHPSVTWDAPLPLGRKCWVRRAPIGRRKVGQGNRRRWAGTVGDGAERGCEFDRVRIMRGSGPGVSAASCARRDLNPHALRRWNLNRAIRRPTGPNGGNSRGCRGPDGANGLVLEDLPTVCRQLPIRCSASRSQGEWHGFRDSSLVLLLLRPRAIVKDHIAIVEDHPCRVGLLVWR